MQAEVDMLDQVRRLYWLAPDSINEHVVDFQWDSNVGKINIIFRSYLSQGPPDNCWACSFHCTYCSAALAAFGGSDVIARSPMRSESNSLVLILCLARLASLRSQTLQ